MSSSALTPRVARGPGAVFFNFRLPPPRTQTHRHTHTDTHQSHGATDSDTRGAVQLQARSRVGSSLFAQRLFGYIRSIDAPLAAHRIRNSRHMLFKPNRNKKWTDEPARLQHAYSDAHTTNKNGGKVVTKQSGRSSRRRPRRRRASSSPPSFSSSDEASRACLLFLQPHRASHRRSSRRYYSGRRRRLPPLRF